MSMLDVTPVMPLLEKKGFKRSFMFGHYTRHRWWHFWNWPNGGDLLIISTHVWHYSEANKVSGVHGWDVESLRKLLETL